MERFLMLWDEIDELVSYGYHLTVALSAAVSRRRALLVRRLRRTAATAEA